MAWNNTRAFDDEAFYAILDWQRDQRGLTWRQLADQAGVSASLLTRLSYGNTLSVDSFLLLLDWLGIHDVRPFRRSRPVRLALLAAAEEEK
jgi:transcriptional regulator with XRE-family HTH domain